MVHTLRRQSILNPELCSVRMSTAIENSGSAYLKGRSVLGNNQLNIVISLENLVNTVMQKANADHTLAGTYHLGRTGTGLGVLINVLIQLLEILHGIIVASHLDHGIDHQLGCAGSIRIGQHDQSFILFLGQIIPGLGSFQVQTL